MQNKFLAIKGAIYEDDAMLSMVMVAMTSIYNDTGGNNGNENTAKMTMMVLMMMMMMMMVMMMMMMMMLMLLLLLLLLMMMMMSTTCEKMLFPKYGYDFPRIWRLKKTMAHIGVKLLTVQTGFQMYIATRFLYLCGVSLRMFDLNIS